MISLFSIWTVLIFCPCTNNFILCDLFTKVKQENILAFLRAAGLYHLILSIFFLLSRNNNKTFDIFIYISHKLYYCELHKCLLTQSDCMLIHSVQRHWLNKKEFSPWCWHGVNKPSINQSNQLLIMPSATANYKTTRNSSLSGMKDLADLRDSLLNSHPAECSAYAKYIEQCISICW